MSGARDTGASAPAPLDPPGHGGEPGAQPASGDGSATSPGRGGQRRTRRRWRRGLAVFAVVLLLELGLGAGWAVWQGLQARDDLTTARDRAAEGREALTELDIAGARQAFEEAAEGFASGSDRLSDPVLGTVGLVPPARDDLRTARALAEGGELVADAALDVLATVDDLPQGLQSLAPSDGRLPVDALAALAPASSAALEKLDRAAALVEGVDGEVVAQIADAREAFSSQVTEARDMVALAALVSGSLPEFLGEDGPRRYLLAAQNPAELRGTGGFLGVFSVVTLEEGSLSFGDFIPIQELTSVPVNEVEPPNADYAARYDRFGGAGFWQGLNATPDFPSAAVAMEQLWETTRGESVDGVIAVDPMAFRELIELSGPVEVPNFGTVRADEVVEVVANEAYGKVGDTHEERKRVLGAIAAGALQGALTGGDIAPTAAISSFTEIARGRHLLLHSTDEQVQRAFAELGLTGELLDPAGDFLSVIVNSASSTKLDFYMDRTVEYDVDLVADGSATATATVTFANDAPTTGLPGRVIGNDSQYRDLSVGENRSYVSVYCATSCEVTGAPDGFATESELGHPVVSGFIQVESGDEVTVRTTWEVAGAWDPADGTYRLTYQGQPTIRPTQLDVRVTPPEGWLVNGKPRRSIKADGTPQMAFELEQS